MEEEKDKSLHYTLKIGIVNWEIINKMQVMIRLGPLLYSAQKKIALAWRLAKKKNSR